MRRGTHFWTAVPRFFCSLRGQIFSRGNATQSQESRR